MEGGVGIEGGVRYGGGWYGGRVMVYVPMVGLQSCLLSF